MLEEDLAGPNLFLWANEGSRCFVSASPKGLDGSYHGHIVSVSPASFAKSVVGRKGDRNFILCIGHAIVPWREESTTSTP